MTRLLLTALLLAGAARPAPAMAADADALAPFVRLALDCTGQEYPNKIAHVMQSDADTGTPAQFTPAFYGCFDWHSAVHGHWQLARFARLHPDHPLAAEARAVLDAHLTPANIAVETAYLLGEGRASWERPYGLAWLLQLAAELREWDDPDARRWSAALAPLEEACARRLADWLPKLAYPIRTGEHSQTAFAFGLVLDWARGCGQQEMAALVEETGLRLYRHDPAAVLAFEPSGQDFLSPALAEADFMRRVLEPAVFAQWLAGFLPGDPRRRRRRLAAGGHRHRPHRRQAGPPRRPEPVAGLDAGGHRRRPAGRRSAPGRPAGCRRRPPRRRPGRVDRRALRGQPLAGHLRALPGERPWAARRALIPSGPSGGPMR